MLRRQGVRLATEYSSILRWSSRCVCQSFPVGRSLRTPVEILLKIPPFRSFGKLTQMDYISQFMDFDRRNAFAEADTLYRSLESTPDSMVCELVVKLYCKSGNLDLAENVLNSMLERSLRPSLLTYHFLIHGLCFYQKYSELDQFFELLQRRESTILKEGRIQTPVFRAYREQGRWSDASLLFNRIQQSGYYLCSTAYIHYLTSMQETEHYELSVDSFEYQRNFDRAVTDLHFSLFLTALCHLKSFDRILSECSAVLRSRSQWLGPFVLPSLADASDATHQFEVALQVVGSISLDKSQLIRKDGVFSSLLHILRHDAQQSKLNELVTFALTDGLLLCQTRTFRECLLHLSTKDDTTIASYFRHIAKSKSNLSPTVISPFLESLESQQKLPTMKKVYEILASAPLLVHPGYLSYFVRAFSEMDCRDHIEDISRSYGHLGVHSLQLSLAQAFDRQGELSSATKYFQEYLQNGMARVLDPSVIQRVCDLSITTGNRDLYRMAVQRYYHVMGVNADLPLIDTLIDRFQKRFSDDSLRNDLKLFL